MDFITLKAYDFHYDTRVTKDQPHGFCGIELWLPSTEQLNLDLLNALMLKFLLVECKYHSFKGAH